MTSIHDFFLTDAMRFIFRSMLSLLLLSRAYTGAKPLSPSPLICNAFLCTLCKWDVELRIFHCCRRLRRHRRRLLPTRLNIQSHTYSQCRLETNRHICYLWCTCIGTIFSRISLCIHTTSFGIHIAHRMAAIRDLNRKIIVCGLSSYILTALRCVALKRKCGKENVMHTTHWHRDVNRLKLKW